MTAKKGHFIVVDIGYTDLSDVATLIYKDTILRICILMESTDKVL